jgi:truncated hemoglobin YjbI
MATQDSPSLYERLGGVYSIATVVDDLIDRVMADQRLNANPLVDEAHHKVPPAGFKYLVTEMLCWAAGGPQKYTGKDMLSSHRHLRITPGERDAFMTTWRRRSTSSRSRRPSGPRWWPSSRAHGLTASFKDAAERAEKSGFGPTPDSAEVVRLVGCRWLLLPSSWLPSFECMMLCQRSYCSGHFQQSRSRGGR